MATRQGGVKKTKDWRRTIGIFSDDEGMKQLFEEALKLREKNRQQARRKLKKKPSEKS